MGTQKSTITMPSNNAAYIEEPKKIPLEVKSAPWTEPKDNQILVRNRAIGINPVDIVIQQFAAFEVEYPAIIGTDVAGVVESVGPGVSQFKPGDRVLGYATSLGTKDNAEGAFQEYSIIRSDCASKIPDDLPFEQATVLPLAVATASYAFFGDDTLQLRLPCLNAEKIDEVVLVWGGSSSVGGTAIRWPRRLATRSSPPRPPRTTTMSRGSGPTTRWTTSPPVLSTTSRSSFRARSSPACLTPLATLMALPQQRRLLSMRMGNGISSASGRPRRSFPRASRRSLCCR